MWPSTHHQSGERTQWQAALALPELQTVLCGGPSKLRRFFPRAGPPRPSGRNESTRRVPRLWRCSHDCLCSVKKKRLAFLLFTKRSQKPLKGIPWNLMNSGRLRVRRKMNCGCGSRSVAVPGRSFPGPSVRVIGGDAVNLEKASPRPTAGVRSSATSGTLTTKPFPTTSPSARKLARRPKWSESMEPSDIASNALPEKPSHSPSPRRTFRTPFPFSSIFTT